METNSVNTDLSEELLNSLAKEERTELLDFINNYPFINWMVSANRPYAKDVPKDKTGKIIVDVVKPHILENTNYFRKAAVAYKKYGRYTNLRPNGNPNSPYMKWLRKEVLKCWYGCKRPSDGEWITGYHYFYLNYSPIERSTSTVGDSKAVGRVVDFPDFYDLDYLFFHYVNQARYGGKYNNYEGGQHCGIIAARGKGKMIPNSTIVYTPSGYKIWKDIHPGDYLYGDNGKPTKVLEEFNHKDKPIYKLTLKDGRVAYAGLEHLWTIKYGDKLITVDTQWIIEHLHKDRIIIPLNKPVQIKERPISLDPFRYGLSIKTRVNDNYKFNSESIRRKVLEGILSRSKIIGFGTVKFTTKYSKLADDVLWLGRSLGYICREEKIRVINRTIYSVYVQNFYTNLDKYIEITNVEYSHNEDAKCVIVDNDSHLFLMNDFIVTHNSFKVSSMSARNFILGENMDVCEKVKSLVVASNTEYLKKDGTLNKTLAMADFLAKSTQFPSNRVKSSTQDMHWIMGYRDPKNKDVISGTKNEILGLSFNNDSDRGRGKRPVAYGTKILTPKGYVKAEELGVGDIIYGDDGKETKIVAVPFDGEEELYKVTLRDKRTIIVGKDHEFEVTYNNKKKITKILSLSKIIKLKNSNKYNVISIRNNSVVQFKEQELKIHPYVMGLFLGDGCYRQSHNNAINITMSLKDIKAIAKYIPYNIEYSKFREITHRIHLIEEDSKSYAKKILDYYGLKNKKCHDKFIPKEYLYNSEENRYELLRGLMDTDGTCTKEHCIEYCTKSPQLKEDIMFLIRSLGMNCTCYKKIIKENVYYRVRIFATNKPLFHLKRKQDRIRKEDNKFSKAYTDKTSILSIEYYGKGKAKCFTVDNKSHLFLAEDFIITHNSQLIVWEEFGMFPNFLDAWNTSRPNTEEGGFAFGQSIAIGTGGSSGSDFSGALEMIYNPLGYNVYGIPNVYDKGASGGAKCIFFIGEYMNRKGCYDKDGNSDIVKAVLEEVKERVFIKYNSSDPSTIAQRIAEHPMSIQEAIMRRDGTLFPVADLTDHLNYIEANKIEWNRGHLVGELSQDPNGNISFKPTDDEPIRDFPLKDNRHRGALEIYELPKEVNGKVPSYRYIAGVDPIDDDHSTTVSLPSIIVLDMFTDRVVAEYTGRPDFADDFYEICRRLGIYYNALINYENDKKGLFTYFSNNHCTYLLAQTPEILRDTELVKSSLYGNKSFGTQSGKQVNAYARRLIRDWLLMPVKQTKIEVDENGNEVEKTVTVKNLQRLRGVAMIKELIMWNPDINADRVSALGMLMILRENNMKYLPGEGTSTGKKVRKNYLGNDPFFTNNFANTTFW